MSENIFHLCPNLSSSEKRLQCDVDVESSRNPGPGQDETPGTGTSRRTIGHRVPRGGRQGRTRPDSTRKRWCTFKTERLRKDVVRRRASGVGETTRVFLGDPSGLSTVGEVSWKGEGDLRPVVTVHAISNSPDISGGDRHDTRGLPSRTRVAMGRWKYPDKVYAYSIIYT